MTLEEAKTELRKLIDIQSQDGNWNYNSYMHGMANGMILAESILADKEPDYIDAPEEWLQENKQ